jgi:hypothetical protein
MNKKYMVETLLERATILKKLVGNGKITKQRYFQILPYNEYDSIELRIQCLMRRTKDTLKEYDMIIAEAIYKYE